MPQAIQLLESIKVHTPAGAARLELARDLIDDLYPHRRPTSTGGTTPATLVTASGTTLTEIHDAGPVMTATVLGFVADITRFASRDHSAA